MRDIVITSAIRTPVGAYMGSLKTVPPDELAAPVLKEALVRSNIHATDVDQVIMGHVISHEPNVARLAALLAGFPTNIPAYTVDRQCGSGLQAIIDAALYINAGEAEVIVAGGTDVMSRSPYYLPDSVRYQGFRAGNVEIIDAFGYASSHAHPAKLYPGLNMGITAENIAKRYNISRTAQDEFAYDSQRKWKEAHEAGKFKDEILPVTVKERRREFVFDTDEHPKPGTTLEGLSTLKPAFIRDGTGTVTAGNSSGMNDGASAVVVMSADAAKKLGCSPLVRVVSVAAAAVDPEVMGLGPVPAVRKILKETGLTIDDIDLLECNEAFAAQTLGCLIELGMEPGSKYYDRVNVNGGAIAHGHALSNSGPRMLATMINELKRRNSKYGIVTLCCGGGQGVAVLFENC